MILHCTTLTFWRCIAEYSTVYCLPSAVTHAPFHASVLRPTFGPMHETARTGKLINAALSALLSLINEACVSICCSTLLLSQLVCPACVQTRSSNPRGRACGPSGKGSGEEGILSGIVSVYLYCPAFNISVSLGVYSGHACLQAAQPLSIPRPWNPNSKSTGLPGIESRLLQQIASVGAHCDSAHWATEAGQFSGLLVPENVK